MSLSVKVRNKKSRLFDFVSSGKKELVQSNIKLEFVVKSFVDRWCRNVLRPGSDAELFMSRT